MWRHDMSRGYMIDKILNTHPTEFGWHRILGSGAKAKRTPEVCGARRREPPEVCLRANLTWLYEECIARTTTELAYFCVYVGIFELCKKNRKNVLCRWRLDTRLQHVNWAFMDAVSSPKLYILNTKTDFSMKLILNTSIMNNLHISFQIVAMFQPAVDTCTHRVPIFKTNVVIYLALHSLAKTVTIHCYYSNLRNVFPSLPR